MAILLICRLGREGESERGPIKEEEGGRKQARKEKGGEREGVEEESFQIR